MHSPTAALADQPERLSLYHRMLAGVLIGICLIFLLPPEADRDSLFDLLTVAGLVGAATVFCVLYRFWPGERR